MIACILAAESLGTVVPLDAALARPERFDGLVLVDGGPNVNEKARSLIAGSLADGTGSHGFVVT